MSERRVRLYHADGCHLCERALEVVEEARTRLSFSLELVDITGNEFEFTAKTDIDLPDTDPSVVEVDWTETTTPTQGTTWLRIPSSVTVNMQALPYFYQLRMIQSPTSPAPIVTPLFSGTLTVLQPVSTRYS